MLIVVTMVVVWHLAYRLFDSSYKILYIFNSIYRLIQMNFNLVNVPIGKTTGWSGIKFWFLKVKFQKCWPPPIGRPNFQAGSLEALIVKNKPDFFNITGIFLKIIIYIIYIIGVQLEAFRRKFICSDTSFFVSGDLLWLKSNSETVVYSFDLDLTSFWLRITNRHVTSFR